MWPVDVELDMLAAVLDVEPTTATRRAKLDVSQAAASRLPAGRGGFRPAHERQTALVELRMQRNRAFGCVLGSVGEHLRCDIEHLSELGLVPRSADVLDTHV